MIAAIFTTLLMMIQPQQGILDPSPKVDTTHSLYTLSFDSTQNLNRNVVVNRIFIVGNSRTKDHIILRELDIKAGDMYFLPMLQEVLEKDRKKIINTRLFNYVELSVLDISETRVDIMIRVAERWYTFPIPIFTLVDRNFNDWWVNQNHDFRRVNYGLRLYQENLRGRNDRLRVTAQLGFTRQFDLDYSMPYVDKKQKHGFGVRGSFTQFKNLAYATEGHKQQFLESNELLRVAHRLGVSHTYRNSFYDFHTIELSFNHTRIADTIFTLNPRYLTEGLTNQRYFQLSYQYIKEKRDIIAYPLHGYQFMGRISRYGLVANDNINLTDILVNYARYLPLGNKYYFSTFTSLYASLPQEQPYPNFNALGYGKLFVRGYELYLIEGPYYALNKTTFKKLILSGKKELKQMPMDQFRFIPYAVYLKSFVDVGMVSNFPDYALNSRLSNRLLFGTGIGLDFVTYYDMVLRLEYSVNREQESGLFFAVRKEF
jgi:outer membrane protein assembly factor BamA